MSVGVSLAPLPVLLILFFIFNQFLHALIPLQLDCLLVYVVGLPRPHPSVLLCK